MVVLLPDGEPLSGPGRPASAFTAWGSRSRMLGSRRRRGPGALAALLPGLERHDEVRGLVEPPVNVGKVDRRSTSGRPCSGSPTCVPSEPAATTLPSASKTTTATPTSSSISRCCRSAPSDVGARLAQRRALQRAAHVEDDLAHDDVLHLDVDVLDPADGRASRTSWSHLVRRGRRGERGREQNRGTVLRRLMNPTSSPDRTSRTGLSFQPDAPGGVSAGVAGGRAVRRGRRSGSCR